MKQRGWIRYIKSQFTDTSGVEILRYAKVFVGTGYVRVYRGALERLAILSPCARNLMDYLCAVMDNQNAVENNATRRRYFRVRMADLGVKYTDGTIKNAYTELRECGLLLDMGRGSFRVNPMYFGKNGAKNRDILIKEMYESKAGQQEGD